MNIQTHNKLQLALFEPLFIIPLLQVFWTFFATLNGGIFFREFFVAEFIENNVAGFTFGVLIIFLGVFLLAPRNNSGGGSSVSGAAGSGRGSAAGGSDRVGDSDEQYLRGIADAMAADRRSRKVVDASGIGGGAAGRSVLTELCTQLKSRLTQQMTGTC